jgi:hypothetical protein
MKSQITYQITADNVRNESYFNLVQLCRLTGYAQPSLAIKSIGEVWTVEKDGCGNVVGLVCRAKL